MTLQKSRGAVHQRKSVTLQASCGAERVNICLGGTVRMFFLRKIIILSIFIDLVVMFPLQKHAIPLSAIPCLQYQRALKEEQQNKEGITESSSEEKKDSASEKAAPPGHSTQVIATKIMIYFYCDNTEFSI